VSHQQTASKIQNTEQLAMSQGKSENGQTAAAEQSIGRDILMVVRGVCMGAADVVPGISGGTVALILGIYSRWVTAISHIDSTMLRLAWNRKWREAAERCDLRFLVGLGIGVVVGVGMMTVVMNELLTSQFSRSITMAAFFGMILASGILVARMISFQGVKQLPILAILGVAGAVLAWWLTTLNSGAASEPSSLYLFFCGSVAICAMVLPGISGAMLLLVLGVYEHLTDVLKNLPHALRTGEGAGESLLTVFVFASGCLISLLAFSRFLRWLLARCRVETMSVLCGFIFGALPKIWPYQLDMTPEIEKFRHKDFQAYLPEWNSAGDWTLAGVIVISFLAVLAIHRMVHGPTAQREIV